jgi:hypothetical protein
LTQCIWETPAGAELGPDRIDGSVVGVGQYLTKELDNLLDLVEFSFASIAPGLGGIRDKFAFLIAALTGRADRALVVTFDFVFPTALACCGYSLATFGFGRTPGTTVIPLALVLGSRSD